MHDLISRPIARLAAVTRGRRPLLAAAALLGLAMLLAAGATAGDPPRTDLFVSGSNGYAVYRIPGLVVTSKGTLLAYAEARKTSGSDWDGIDVVIRRSADRGATWSPQQAIGRMPGPLAQNPAGPAQRPADALTYGNPVAIADRRNGVVHFVFCVEYMRAFYMRSADDGKTFSPPVEITSAFEKFRPEYPWKVLATGPGHGIQLQNGRLIVPVWLSTSTRGPHHPSVAATIYSDDGGRTWHGGDVAVPHTNETVDPSETVAVELADGHVMLNVRSESPAHRRLVVISPDGATRWSAPRFQQELVEPICFGSLARYGRPSKRGPNRLLFVNPDNLKRGLAEGQPGRGRDRRNLTLQLSEDDGESWKTKRVIDPEWAGYADLSTSKDGSIYVLYERGEPDPRQFRIAALTLVRLDLSWLLQPSLRAAGVRTNRRDSPYEMD